MAEARRLGAESSQVRARFIDAAEAILAEEGEHGLSARQVAARAGLKAQLLYYYFRTMDDVLLAVVERVNQRRLARFEAALAAPEPLRALWQQMIDPGSAALASAFTALAAQRAVIGGEIVAAAREFRSLQTRVVAGLMPPPKAGEEPVSAAGLVMIAASLARMLVNEQALGLDEGHAEALAIVERMLDRLAAKSDGAHPPPPQ